MKSLFGGGAALTALMTASVLFYAHPLAAEPAFQEPRQQQKKETKTTEPVTQTQETTDTSARQEIAEASAVITAADIAAAAAGRPPAILSASPKPTIAVKEMAETAAAPPQLFTATAYNLSGRTASGRPVSKGLIAADPGLLPLGTRVRIEAGPYSGEYLVADTGGSVRGRKIDVWVPTSREACRFGRRSVKLTVLAYGGRRAKAKAAR